MPFNRNWQTRIKAVELEHRAMHHAAERYRKAVAGDPSLLPAGLLPRDVIRSCDTLESTYLPRLFAEFETGGRQFWATRRSTHPKTADLLEGLAAMRSVSREDLQEAHSVRLYRNSLVHERDERTESVPLAAARGILCRFFSALPKTW